jgi:hypothetical protein
LAKFEDDGLVSLRLGDERVQRCIEIMLAKQWDPGDSPELLAKEWGVSVSTIAHYSKRAAQFLRLFRDADTVHEYLVAELHKIVSESDMDRVPAIKTLLGEIQTLSARSERLKERENSPEETETRMRALLADPPPELEKLLSETGWRRE